MPADLGRTSRRRRRRRPSRGRTPTGSGEVELSDQKLLERLIAEGGDPARPHTLETFLYFPSQAAAGRAATPLQAGGYTTFADPVGDGRWVVEAVIQAAPTAETLARMRTQLRSIAHSAGGIYDGWSAVPIEEDLVEEIAGSQNDPEGAGDAGG